jgi:DNA repair protein RecO (recombination protein O)
VRQRRDEAYVLGTTELGEADLIVILLAEHHGLVRGVAASARKSRRRFGGALEPLTRATAAWVERDGRDLHRIESVEIVRSFATMQSDPARQAACAVLAEITLAVSRDGDPDPRTFRLLGALLEALEAGGAPWAIVRYAEYWTLKLHGVLPDLDLCASCGAPLTGGSLRVVTPQAGLICRACPKPAGAVALRAEDLRALASIDALPPAQAAIPADAARPGGPLEVLLRGALEAFVERTFRSYRHLKAAAPGVPSA